MAFPRHVEVFHRLVPTSIYAFGDKMHASLVISILFSRGMASFLLLLDFPCPLAYFPFVVISFLLSGALIPTTNFAAL